MIVAAGLTPAWQQIISLGRFLPGQVNRAHSVVWAASGKVLNVAIALKTLAAPHRAVWLGGGLTGDLIEEDLCALGVSSRRIQASSPTRICTTLVEEFTGVVTELVENAAAVNRDELAEFEMAFCDEATSAEVVVLTGSLPAGAPPSLYRELASKARGRVILDIRGIELQEALKSRPFLVKPNREELGLGPGPITEDVIFSAMEDLHRGGAEWTLVTQGSGPVLAFSAGRKYRFEALRARVVNPIGCGDCLAAGLALKLFEESNVPDAICFGLAAAAQNLSQLLPAQLDAPSAAELAKTVSGREIESGC